MDTPRPWLVYDGDCGFCTTAANWISRKWPDVEGPIARPWQRLTSGDFEVSHLTEDDFKRTAWWLDEERKESGSRAVARALIAANGLWSVAGRLLLFPPISWVAPLGYSLIARYRYRLPGGTPACQLE
jgi:predicted DCC family thiol-disulfide oxidoreductase YuxK